MKTITRIRSACFGLAVLAGPSLGATRLLAVMPLTESFREAKAGMESDLGSRYEVKMFDVDLPDADGRLERQCKAFSPEGVILMDAKAIQLAKNLQKRDTAFARLPKFVIMTLKAEDATRGLENVAGIRFEVPAYTIFTNFHILSKKDFRKVGVFHRKFFSAFVEDSRRDLAKEHLELIAKCLDCQGSSPVGSKDILPRLEKGMEELRRDGVEVIWMLADNVIVNNTSLRSFWMSGFKDSGLPLVVPLANLASLDLNLGVFAAYPDYYQLGVQAAQLAIQVFESGESPAQIGFEPLISVEMVLNLDVANRLGWEFSTDKMRRVRTILKRP